MFKMGGLMTTVPRHYKAAPAPPPPDEGYWAALLAHEEEDHNPLTSAEEEGWTDADAFQKTPIRDFGGNTGKPEDWAKAGEAFQNDDTVSLNVVGYNKGGLLVEWDSLRGFVPASQLVDTLQSHDANDPRLLLSYTGKQLRLRIIELNQEQNRLIFSERAAQVSSGTRASILHNLRPGTIARGIVTNICDFGVFIDLGGVEGLVHISEISWGRVEHPGEVVERGADIEVYIMDVLPNKGRIALSIKRLLPDPWVTVTDRYCAGQYVQSIITSVVDFGAFAALEEGLEGLIHISELAEGHFLHPRNVVKEGERVEVRILNIDNQARRIGLSLRGVNPD